MSGGLALCVSDWQMHTAVTQNNSSIFGMYKNTFKKMAFPLLALHYHFNTCNTLLIDIFPISLSQVNNGGDEMLQGYVPQNKN